uniref:Uncharacterized protein n=1 Tax=Meleagris gallopavo TaxID=9103 RepID=A0A803XY84_MELGA
MKKNSPTRRKSSHTETWNTRLKGFQESFQVFSLVSQLLTEVIFQVLCSYSFLASTLSTILHFSCKKDSLSSITRQLHKSNQMFLLGLRAQFS